MLIERSFIKCGDAGDALVVPRHYAPLAEIIKASPASLHLNNRDCKLFIVALTVANSPLVELEGRNNCLDGAAVRQQGQDLRDQRDLLLQAIKDRAFARAKGLVTEVTDEAPRRNTKIALPDLAFGRLGQNAFAGTRDGMVSGWTPRLFRNPGQFFKRLLLHGCL